MYVRLYLHLQHDVSNYNRGHEIMNTKLPQRTYVYLQEHKNAYNGTFS